MSEVKFKVGDLVYCPSVLPNIFKLLEVYDSQLKVKTPLRLVNIDRDIAVFLTSDGFDLKSKIPVIFHATQENYELLSQLYPNVAFELPPKRKEPKEFIYDMLNNGYDVVNYIADGTFGFFSKHNIANITYREFNNFVYTRFINDCKDFKVITQKGEVIIDFVDGEVVLENEND